MLGSFFSTAKSSHLPLDNADLCNEIKTAKNADGSPKYPHLAVLEDKKILNYMDKAKRQFSTTDIVGMRLDG